MALGEGKGDRGALQSLCYAEEAKQSSLVLFPVPRPKFSELALKISVCGHIYSIFINKLQIPKSGLFYNSKKTSLPNISIKLLITFLTS